MSDDRFSSMRWLEKHDRFESMYGKYNPGGHIVTVVKSGLGYMDLRVASRNAYASSEYDTNALARRRDVLKDIYGNYPIIYNGDIYSFYEKKIYIDGVLDHSEGVWVDVDTGLSVQSVDLEMDYVAIMTYPINYQYANGIYVTDQGIFFIKTPSTNEAKLYRLNSSSLVCEEVQGASATSRWYINFSETSNGDFLMKTRARKNKSWNVLFISYIQIQF